VIIDFEKAGEMKDHVRAEKKAVVGEITGSGFTLVEETKDLLPNQYVLRFRLAFDRPGTWSQKYNLVWDKLLGLNLLPSEVAEKEIAFYKTRLDRFGLPLDNRKNYTKTDWEVWTATLAKSRFDFDALMGPVYGFVNQTQPRVPMTDWYLCRDARQRGFQARPVIGGVFVKMLSDPVMWKKWSLR